MMESDNHGKLRLKNVDINWLHLRGAFVGLTKPKKRLKHIDITLIHFFSEQ